MPEVSDTIDRCDTCRHAADDHDRRGEGNGSCAECPVGICGARTQTRRLTVRAYTREDAERNAYAQAFARTKAGDPAFTDSQGIAGPWGLASTPTLVVAPEGFEPLFARVDLSLLYTVDLVRVLRPAAR